MAPQSLETRYLVNDLIRNRGVNLALLLILTMSAFLMSTGAVVMERLVGSVDALMEQAQPPHFLQMHKGELNPDALSAFATQHQEIESWLIEDMLGFDGAAISWSQPATGTSGDLSDSRIDNLFVTQNDSFDFLLDEEGRIPQPTAGEVYVPVVHQQGQGLRGGDEIVIRTNSGAHSLRVAGFVRDAQMASSLSSATRFLVSGENFQELVAAGGGDPEVIVEYRLTDPALASQFQTAYESDEALPKNGQAVTHQMIRLVNAFSDGLVALALVFISALLMAIAMLSLRFVIRGTVEEEVHEIGVMKAIGLPHRSIAGLYLTRYRAMALAACIIGGGLSLSVAQLLTRAMQQHYADAPAGPMTFLAPALALLLVYLVVVAMCRGVLRGLRRVEVVGALVHGSVLDEKRTARRARKAARRARRTHLTQAGDSSINQRLARLDLRADLASWALIPAVFALAALAMVLPTNLLTTFESPRFVTYMGAPEGDLRVDIQFTDDAPALHQRILHRMLADDRIVDISDSASTLHQTWHDGSWEAIRVQVGDHAGDSLHFLSGGAPGQHEIALSVHNASHHSLSVGNDMTLGRPGSDATHTVTVSGIYQDVTSGGRTAKMHGAVPPDAESFVILAGVTPGADAAAIAAEYTTAEPTATVLPMREYVNETLGSITNAFRSAAILATVLGIGISLAITVLFITLRVTRERSRMGVLTALGFSTRELMGQIMMKVLVMVSLGAVVGTVLAMTLGESLVGALIALSGLGITRLDFIVNPWLVYLAYPLLLIATGCAGALALTSRLRVADKSEWLRS